jgi:putative membrane protein
MKLLPVAAVAIGLALTAALVAHWGAGAVLGALFAIGWTGFAAVCAVHLALVALMGIAWWALWPSMSAWAAVWGRLVREAAAEVLPLSQIGGYVAGARAIGLTGVALAAATASTIVDVSVEFLAQLAYTALALGLLVELRPQASVAAPVAVALLAALALAAGFVAAQRRGFDLLGRLARRLGHGWAERTAAGADALHAAVAAIYRRRAGLWLSFLLHLFCWVVGAAEAWLALRLAGASLGFGPVLVVESLLYAVRSLAFVVPNAVGVQEGAYILIGAGFGLTPQMALALSLLKRARDLTIGLPVLGAWQLAESARWRRRLARRAAGLPPRAAATGCRASPSAPPSLPRDEIRSNETAVGGPHPPAARAAGLPPPWTRGRAREGAGTGDAV